jgi:phage terminase small subunit
MSKPLRNPKHEKFARAIVNGTDLPQAYVDAGFQRNRANHNRLVRDPRIKARIAELTEERELVTRAARAPVQDVLTEFQKHGIERVADFYRFEPAGGLVVRDLRAVKTEIALALLNSLQEGFGIQCQTQQRN